jgi:hypothetical protein
MDQDTNEGVTANQTNAVAVAVPRADWDWQLFGVNWFLILSTWFIVMGLPNTFSEFAGSVVGVALPPALLTALLYLGCRVFGDRQFRWRMTFTICGWVAIFFAAYPTIKQLAN